MFGGKYGGGIAISSIISNGNFVSTTGWTGTTVTGFTVSNNEASFTATANSGQISKAPSPATISTNKYYAKADVKATSSIVTLYFGSSGKAHSGSGNYETLSLIHTATASHSIRITDNRASNWTLINVKNVVVINLTAIFGAGNEPTLAWCNANLPTYFDTFFL